MGEVIHGDYSRWVNDEMLHSVTNYELHKSIYSGHNDHNYFEIAHNVRRLEAIGQKLYTFVDNHDEDRIASKLLNPEHLYPVYTVLFTLPGIPSVYYGSEWGLEGKRTKTSDDMLRPKLSMSDEKNTDCELEHFIGRLGKIRQENEEFHQGVYKELLLTNRQYAYSRSTGGSSVIIAVNNDEAGCNLSVPCPFEGSVSVDLLSGNKFPVKEHKIELTIPACRSVVLKITEG